MLMRIFRYMYSWLKMIRYFPSTMHMLRLQAEEIAVYRKEMHENTSTIIRNVQQIVNTAFLHRDVFKKYKNIHASRDIVLVGAGPSLNKYKPIEGAVHIAVNRAILFENTKFDYLFTQHYPHEKHLPKEYHYLQYFDALRYENLKIFYGILRHDKNYTFDIIPESIALKHNAERFYTTQNRHNTFHGTYQIDSEEIYNTGQDMPHCGTVSYVAFQFALYTNPKRIYLVGMDSASNGYFNNLEQTSTDWEAIINGWKELKYFADVYYPDTEIVSINPVGLAGIFHDINSEE